LTGEQKSSLPTTPASGGVDAEASDLQKLVDGLDAFAAWAEDLPNSLAASLELPFVELSLADLWHVPGGEITAGVGASIRDEIVGLFADGGPVSSADLLALPAVQAGPSGRLTEFEATIGLASTPTLDLELSLQTIKDLGLDLTRFSFLELKQSPKLHIDVTLDLRFGFGLDAGEFYIEDPTLVGRVTVHHDKPLNVSLSVGPIGIGIEDGTVFLQAGLILPTEGRFAVEDLASLDIGALQFDPQSSYELDLPFKLLGPLAGLGDDIGRLHGSFNRDAASSGGVEDLSLTQFFTMVPQTLNFEGGNFGALFDLSNVSLDAALEGIVCVIGVAGAGSPTRNCRS
jgi:hypothetical protein